MKYMWDVDAYEEGKVQENQKCSLKFLKSVCQFI